MTPQQLIARARSAIGLPTLYWLGQGGYDPSSPTPGSTYTVREMIDETDSDKQGMLMKIARDTGYPESRWRETIKACDCSGFTNWVVQIVRGGPALSWIDTGAMYRFGGRVPQYFEQQSQPSIGSLVVYPAGRRGAAYGHVGVVTEVSNGQVARVVHCSSTNFLAPPYDSIAETGPDVFLRHRPVRYLRPKILSDMPGQTADL
jgi:cell wall-associated NlpC family hydrolase